MEFVLVIVTIVSLSLAVAMAALGWRLIRDNRARSAARVEALEALAAETPMPIAEAAPRARFSTIEDDLEPAMRPAARMATPAPIAAVEAPVVAPRPTQVADVRIPHDVRPPARSTFAPEPVRSMFGQETAMRPEPMFGGAEEKGAPSRRWVALAGVAAVMAVLTLTIYAISRPSAISSFFAPRVSAEAASTVTAQPLELISLKHSTDPDGSFNVVGLVQNPANGKPFQKVVAVLYLFAPDGSYFATGRAALDVPLEPGAESPFAIHVANVGKVGRYRVGFRLEDGAVVAHVDRRGQPLERTTDATEAPRALNTKGN
jgi:hypothetical protein